MRIRKERHMELVLLPNVLSELDTTCSWSVHHRRHQQFNRIAGGQFAERPRLQAVA
ncbi:hypothetical protein MCOR25_007642, partial [Pyricularia grisea]